jgi:ATP-dependent DNA helicase DinG
MNDVYSSWLTTAVAAFFSEDGPLASSNPGYLPRAPQQTMAAAVAHAIDRREALVVEAGTGVGKTYAYLAPALLSGRRVMISTATKALQDQLFLRDLPALMGVLGLPLRLALLKGRSSYLCLQRMEEAWQRMPGGDRYVQEQLRRVEVWATCTTTGDLAEVGGLDEQAEVRPLITSTRDNCLGSACPHVRDCHVNVARARAQQADVVVINHHLFMADCAVREEDVGEFLPLAEVMVFDEAHQLPEVSVQFLGTSMGARQWIDWSRDLVQLCERDVRGFRAWRPLAQAVTEAVEALGDCLPDIPPESASDRRLPWEDSAPSGVSAQRWHVALEGLRLAVVDATSALKSVVETSADLGRLLARGQHLVDRFETILAGSPQEAAVRWVTPGKAFRWHLVPLSVAQTMGRRVQQSTSEARRTWVFTSATLGADPELSWFTQAMGLSGAVTMQLGSPFDYAHQAAVHVPLDLPEPGHSEHPHALADKLWPWAMRLSGRTLVLTTTLRAMELIGQRLTTLSQQDLGPSVLVQGEASKRELLERFRRASQSGGGGAVLVASASFWEGVDLPGDALQMVVIDKLPFPPPDDPWVSARSSSLREQGLSPFRHYFLPEAAVALKQGAGRLIRSETDKGLLVIGDVRLAVKPYGKWLRRALPPMRWLDTGDIQSWLEELVTTASTRDLPWT